MVTRRVSEEAVEQWPITSAAVAQAYRFIQRWILRRARVWAMNRVLQFLPDTSGYNCLVDTAAYQWCGRLADARLCGPGDPHHDSGYHDWGAPGLGCNTIRVQYHWGRNTTEVVLKPAQARLPELQRLHWEH